MNDQDDVMPLPAGVLAKRLGTYQKRIYREVAELGIKPEIAMYEGRKLLCYPVGTLTILRVVIEQKREELSLPAFMSVQEIADALGKSYGWTLKAIKKHGFQAGKYEQRRAFRATLYRKSEAYRTLRDEVRAKPVAESGLNLAHLVELTGFDRDWIVNRLREANIQPALRWSPLTGKTLGFYDESIVELLHAAPQYPEAASWLTADAIEKLVGKSSNWTRARLHRPNMQARAEVRLDPHRVPRLHYPAKMIDILRAEIASAEKYPQAGDWLLIYQIAKQLGRSTLWVQNRLKLLGITGELRRDGKGRAKDHYPPSTGARLLREAPDDLRTK